MTGKNDVCHGPHNGKFFGNICDKMQENLVRSDKEASILLKRPVECIWYNVNIEMFWSLYIK